MESSDSLQSLQKEILSPNIKLLGDILGEVLIDQEGKQMFDLEEDVRLYAKEFREADNYEAFKELRNKLSETSNPDKKIMIKAFSHFFNLANLAEEYYKIKTYKMKEKDPENTNNLTYTMNYAQSQGITSDQLKQLMKRIKIQLVWTSHPTEARRLTIMMKLREIYSLLTRIQKHKPSDHEYMRIRKKITEQITLLWQSDELREDKVELLDEVRTVLWYFDNTLFDVIPELYIHLQQHLEDSSYDNPPVVEIPKFLEFGSWVGGDRDGHPGVTADVTIQTLLLQKRLCLRKYLKSVGQLIQHISTSTNVRDVSKDLQESIKEDEKAFPEFSSQTRKLNQLERYRRKLDFMRLKLENTLKRVEQNAVDIGLGHTLVGYSEDGYEGEISNFYERSAQFYSDLRLIYRSLMENNGEIIANGLLSNLIVKVQVFGFHLAPLDLRQDADVHLSAITEIFDLIGLEKLSSLSKDEQCKILVRELKNPRPLGISAIRNRLSDRSKEIIKTLRVASDSIQRVSPRSISTYIISMSTHERDVLVLMLLMNEVGLIEIEKINGDYRVSKAYMDIAPLFETKEDLENAPEVMHRLYNMDLYQSYLELRENVQEIMIGYSDSTKDVGILESNFRLITAQQQLVQITNDHGYQIRIFHGRGGSVSRGGGPTNRALLSLPPNTVFDVKITEQGEVIGQSYSNREIAQSHLEGIISAMIVRGITDTYVPIEDNPANIRESDLEVLRELSSYACSTYEQMVKQNQKFIPFYMNFTPLDLIERATIGSRPSRRTKESVSNINALRAIPWVFSWTQTRLIFPGYFGLGSALKHIKEKQGLDNIRKLYEEFPYFQSMINNIQMVMLKVDTNISQLYLDLLPEEDYEDLYEIYKRIEEEYELTRKLILEVSQTDELLGISPDIANSIKRRNPYMDPLSIIQVLLLTEWRDAGKPSDMDNQSLQRLLLQTVNGIAAGLKNTG